MTTIGASRSNRSPATQNQFQVLRVTRRRSHRMQGVRYPLCLAGLRACPPKDCGGVPGYENLRRILPDATHEDHDETPLLELTGQRCRVRWQGSPRGKKDGLAGASVFE